MKRTNTGTILIIILLCIVIILLLGIMISGIAGSIYGSDLFIKKNNISSISENLDFDASDIKKIRIDSEYGNVELQRSEDNQIHIEGNSSAAYSISAEKEGALLTVKRHYNAPHISFIKNPKVNTTVYLPENFDCEIEIDTDFGNICASLALKGRFNFSTDLGNIELNKISGQFELSTNMGNIEISEAQIRANSTAETDMGDIDISKANSVNFIASTDMGSSKVYGSDGSSPVSLKAESDMGNVKINN